jgi:hypothetical protein
MGDAGDVCIQIFASMLLKFLYDLYKWYNTIDHNAVINAGAC